MTPLSRIIAVAVLAAGLAACRGGGDAVVAPDAVASVAGDVLTRAEVRRNVPAGISAADSAAVAKAYVKDWIEQKLIEHVAASQVDMVEIDRLTAEYRRRLITTAYRREMARHADGVFSDDSLRAYYDAHTADFRLTAPMVKGVYLKVPSDAAALREIRRLYRSHNEADIDRLEKAALGTAIHYDYFRDNWIDWEQIATRIPLEFTAADIERLRSQGYIETDAQGFAYLLAVNDFLPAGAVMPYEAAVPLVRERLLTRRRRAYDAVLRTELYRQALADGTLVLY